ncbi:hypothetical protein [Nannocystis bainbridge]|uniref:Uncharacterized protein n=1 Tax=Nannocystis bainbridge TaxID=2995303 RepID=A0ABT5E773_9BACT|nr:hypothetical protein [Nannocystis bainbridge]MDC0721721.1 hypothetical protein [Nannocystis bainbridge]
MAVIDRHRVARLVELSAAERTLKGPERQLREEDVKLLIKAAYDDATDAARADFMARVQRLPTSAWPWSAVQLVAPRGGTGVSLGSIVGVPRPALVPALLVLIRGQADSADLDPGNRLPEPGSPEFAEWEPLQRALDTWDTQTITKSIGPQGWVSMMGNTSGQVSKDTNGATSGAPAPSPSPGPTEPATKDLPAPQPPATPAEITWKHPAVLAAGAAVVLATGVAVYAVSQSRSRRELEDVLSQQEEQP